MPDASKQNSKIDLTVIVNGQPTIVEVNHNALLEKVVEKALHQTHTKGQPAEAWEIRDAAGVALELGKKVGEFGFLPGTQLFLNLKAGVGG
jgi:predicted nucleotide-binding protein (sugar kinase/HSP70/actin superfamily)